MTLPVRPSGLPGMYCGAKTQLRFAGKKPADSKATSSAREAKKNLEAEIAKLSPEARASFEQAKRHKSMAGRAIVAAIAALIAGTAYTTKSIQGYDQHGEKHIYDHFHTAGK